MRRNAVPGYTLIELMVVIVIGGLLLAMSIPALKGFTKSNDLKSASLGIVTQLSLAREKAISTGATQTLRFMKDYLGASDYHVWSNSVARPSWKLPNGVTYNWGAGTQNTYRMTSDGRCLDSGTIILENEAGVRDTISVRLSGLVLVY